MYNSKLYNTHFIIILSFFQTGRIGNHRSLNGNTLKHKILNYSIAQLKRVINIFRIDGLVTDLFEFEFIEYNFIVCTVFNLKITLLTAFKKYNCW